jgi:lysozyme
MKSRYLAALAAVVALAGCGSTVTHTVTELAPAPQVTYIPPESSVTPEGAITAPPPVSLAPTVKHELTIDATGLHLIEGFEGYQRCAYWDPYGRVWTAGFGQTKGVYRGFCFSGRNAAEANLKRSVQAEYEWAVHQIGYPFNQHEVDALDSFSYNLGSGIFSGTLRSDLEHGQVYAASRIMLAYDHAGGVVLAGLKTRRELEVRLLLTPVAKPAAKRNRTAEHAHLKKLDIERAKIRRHLLNAGCRVKHPRPACTPLFRRGAVVNREIRVLHSRLY